MGNPALAGLELITEQQLETRVEQNLCRMHEASPHEPVLLSPWLLLPLSSVFGSETVRGECLRTGSSPIKMSM